jgi:hypothetical protein
MPLAANVITAGSQFGTIETLSTNWLYRLARINVLRRLLPMEHARISGMRPAKRIDFAILRLIVQYLAIEKQRIGSRRF